jgi:CheY-like chemotaxis protein
MRVLVVEDNPINQHVLQHMLMVEGASVWLADNGQQGVDAVRESLAQQAFDVVLMDLQMPVMDGFQATREIRDGLALKQLPIIAVSANVQAADRAQSLAAGINVHIGKPYVLDELVAVMRRLTGLPEIAHTPELTDAIPVEVSSPVGAVSALHAYWIRANPNDGLPDSADLMQQGVVLHLLDSVEALASHMADNARPASLVVADLATANSEPMRALVRQNGASMNSMALVVLADAVTEDDMLACIHSGAVDMLLLPYALDNLGAISRKHINAQGELRMDPNNKVVAIDGHGAMERIQSDLPFFGDLLRAFFDELPQRWQLLRDDWNLNPDQVKHRSHALKGLAVTLGLESLAQVARQVEALEPHPGEPIVPNEGLLLQLQGEMQSARFQILRWLTEYQPAQAVPL